MTPNPAPSPNHLCQPSMLLSKYLRHYQMGKKAKHLAPVNGVRPVGRLRFACAGAEEPGEAPRSVVGSLTQMRHSAELEVHDTSVLMSLTTPNGRLLEEVSRCAHAQVDFRGNKILVSGEEPNVELARRF